MQHAFPDPGVDGRETPNAVPILFTHFGDNWLRGSEIQLLDLLRNLDRRRVRPIVWCNAPLLADAAREAGYVTYRSDFRPSFYDAARPLEPRSLLASIGEGHRLVRRHGVRLLHANSAVPTQWLAPVARCNRLPLVTHLHSVHLRRFRFAALLHQASLVVGVSRPVISDLLADGMPAARLTVIHNGIDLAALAPTQPDQAAARAAARARLGVAAGTTVIASAGSLIPRKGHDVLLRALAGLHGRAIHLLLASDGPQRAALESLAANLGIAGRVSFLGHQDRLDLAELYRASDIMALASRSEAFGLVLAEAGFFGLPVVATAVGGIPEVVVDGQTGLLVPPDDAAALARALARLIDDPAERQRMGRAAQARAESHFTVRRMADDFHAVYERLLRVPPRQLGWLAALAACRPYVQLLRRGN